MSMEDELAHAIRKYREYHQRATKAEAILRSLAAVPSPAPTDPGDGEYTMCALCNVYAGCDFYGRPYDGAGPVLSEVAAHRPSCPWRRAVEWADASPPETIGGGTKP